MPSGCRLLTQLVGTEAAVRPAGALRPPGGVRAASRPRAPSQPSLSLRGFPTPTNRSPQACRTALPSAGKSGTPLAGKRGRPLLTQVARDDRHGDLPAGAGLGLLRAAGAYRDQVGAVFVLHQSAGPCSSAQPSQPLLGKRQRHRAGDAAVPAGEGAGRRSPPQPHSRARPPTAARDPEPLRPGASRHSPAPAWRHAAYATGPPGVSASETPRACATAPTPPTAPPLSACALTLRAASRRVLPRRRSKREGGTGGVAERAAMPRWGAGGGVAGRGAARGLAGWRAVSR